MKKYLLIILFFLTSSIFAEESPTIFTHINMPDSAVSSTKNNITGYLIITTNESWESEWQKASEITPNIQNANTVHVGENITYLLFISNPKLDSFNKLNVVCNIKETNKNNVVHNFTNGDFQCGNGEVRSPANNVIMLKESIFGAQYTTSDTPGIRKIDVTIEDKNSNTKLELHTEFNLVKGNG